MNNRTDGYSSKLPLKNIQEINLSISKPLSSLALILALQPLTISSIQPAIAQVPESLSLDKKILYVDPSQGNDLANGQKNTPHKTISHALSVAKQGTTIKLAEGTYSEATGEKFPLIIKNKIILEGETKNQGYKTIIQGNGYFISPTGAGQNVAIAAIKDAGGIIGLTVTNNHSRGHGLWIESADPQILSNTFTRNGNTGVSVNGKSTPYIAENYFYNNSGNGLLVYGTSNPEIIENTFEQTGFGVSVVQQAAPNLQDNIFDGNRIGAIFEGEAQGTLRNNQFINSEESGLTAIAKSQIDLGTETQPGNNIFRSNKQLDILNASHYPIIAVGTEIKGRTEGNINFDESATIASHQANLKAPEVATLTTDKQIQPQPIAAIPSTKIDYPEAIETPISEPVVSLPAPPPVLENTENNNNNKELVFTANQNTGITALSIEPVPYPPEIKSTALKANNTQVGSLSDVLGSTVSPIKYKVLVETLSPSEEEEVRGLYPEAFKTIYQGEPWLQVGAFSNWDKAKKAEQTLFNLGLATFLIE